MDFKLALVTGASSGIGSALCHLLAEKGINIILTGRDVKSLQNLADELKDKVSVEIIQLDLVDESERQKIIIKIHEKAPELVINNAGFGLYGEALGHETKVQLDMVKLNVEAVVEITLEAARTLAAKSKQGVILNLSSAASFYVFPCFAVYSASKGFVNSFSEALDVELEPYGIRILSACPGMVETNFRVRAGGTPLDSRKVNGVMSVEFAAKEIWRQISRLKPIHVFNWKYRISLFLSKFLPKRWLAKKLRNRILDRIPKQEIINIK